MCKYILLWQITGFLSIFLTTDIYHTSANNDAIYILYIYKNMVYSSHSFIAVLRRAIAQDNEIINISISSMNIKEIVIIINRLL